MTKFIPLILPVLLGLIETFSSQLSAWVASHPSWAVYIALGSTVIAALTKSVIPPSEPK